MERVGVVHRDLEAAARAEREAMWALTPAERMEIARLLRERVWGPRPPDVRESERSRR